MGHVIHYFTGVLVRTAFHMIIVWELRNKTKSAYDCIRRRERGGTHVVEVNVHVQRL